MDHNVDKKGQPPVEEQMLQVSAIVSERERSEEKDRSLTDCSLFPSTFAQQIEFFLLPFLGPGFK